MHELSIAHEIVATTKAQLRIHNKTEICSLDLKIGVMSGVVIECLKFAMDDAIQETPLQNATINYHKVLLRLQCQDCNEVRITEDFILVCEHCASQRINVLAGKELLIDKMEMQ